LDLPLAGFLFVVATICSIPYLCNFMLLKPVLVWIPKI
jgi:hypothetical protein